MKILIAGAWVYANGGAHIGHIASLLPGDVLARYHRQIGDSVYYVSGSDCYGTPITIEAKRRNTEPAAIAEQNHQLLCDTFQKLGFSYDLYGKTTQKEHRAFVRAFHRRMYAHDYVQEQETKEAYCETCGQFLVERLVEGECPSCHSQARGDQCDDCGTILEPLQLIAPRCHCCGQAVSFKESKQLFLKLTKLKTELSLFVDAHINWRKNAIAFSKRYLNEGLRDRAITRDLSWGIEVPRFGYASKRIYIWAENVLGYLSMSKVVAQQRGEDYEELWSSGGDVRHYYVHGKDNIPFHTIILPGLLLANGGGWRLPDSIISSEYLTLEGRKISTSGNWAIWAQDLASRYDPDTIRYFLITNGPEKRDTDFSFREFILSHNAELLGAYGNFVHRCLAFIQRYLGGRVPQAAADCNTMTQIEELYQCTGERIVQGRFKEGLDGIFEFVRGANKYFDQQRPWETRLSDVAACEKTLHTCVQIIANLGVLLEPFLPFSAKKIRDWLAVDAQWKPKRVPGGYVLPEIDLLFARIDKAQIRLEQERLHSGACEEGEKHVL